MTSSATPSFAYGYYNDASYASPVGDNSLTGAFDQAVSANGSAPHEWHRSPDAFSLSASPSSLPPSTPASPVSSYASSSYTLSPASSPSPTTRKATTRKLSNSRAKKTSTTSRRASKPADYIKRPRNAFMIFRSERSAAVMESRVEHDNRMISQILGKMWNRLDDGEKSYYRRRAADEKEAHMLKYPHYRFAPRPRTEKAKKRNVKRNGPKDKQRCEQVACLLLDGKGGDALKAEIDMFDLSVRAESAAAAPEEGRYTDYSTSVFDSRTWVDPGREVSSPPATPPCLSSPSSSSSSASPASSAYPDSPAAFRSPLFPPSVPHTSTPPLSIPDDAGIDISPLLPLAAMHISPIRPQQSCPQAPNLQTAPLPEVAEQSPAAVAHYMPGDYTTLYRAPAPPSALGLEVHHYHQQPQPQGELRLSQMYPPAMAAILVQPDEFPGANSPYAPYPEGVSQAVIDRFFGSPQAWVADAAYTAEQFAAATAAGAATMQAGPVGAGCGGDAQTDDVGTWSYGQGVPQVAGWMGY